MDKLPSFFYTLTDDLRKNVDISIDFNVSKRTGYVHLTSKIDLQHARAAIFFIVRRCCIVYPVTLDFIQQKGYEYD